MSATATMDSEATGAPSPPSALVRPSAFQQWRSLSRAMLRGFFRDKTSLFFTFFPLMFLVVFGLVFRSDGASRVELAVVGKGPVVSALPKDVMDAVTYDSVDAAVAKVKAGDLPGAVVESGDEVTLYFAASDQVKPGTVQGLVSSVVNQANLAATGHPPTVKLDMQRVESEDFEPIQFLTPGILSWGVATSAAFGAALTLVSWRKRQVLRRLRLAPSPVSAIVGARVGVSLVIALVQAVVFVGVALSPPFGLKFAGDWWLALPMGVPVRHVLRHVERAVLDADSQQGVSPALDERRDARRARPRAGRRRHLASVCRADRFHGHRHGSPHAVLPVGLRVTPSRS